MKTFKKTAVLCIFSLMSFSVFATQTVPVKKTLKHWVSLGNADFASGATQNIFAINGSGVPYYAYLGNNLTFDAPLSVMTLQKGTWIPAGNTVIAPSEASFSFAMAINSEDPMAYPYLAYAPARGSSGPLVVDHFNGTTWVPVDPTMLPQAGGDAVSMTVSNQGIPYVVLITLHTGIVHVLKFSGNTWETVGQPFFLSNVDTYDTDIAVDSNGRPFLAYENAVADPSPSIVVMKLEHSLWTQVGSSIQNVNTFGAFGFSVSKFGIPYVAYPTENTQKPRVVKFDNNQWESIGTFIPPHPHAYDFSYNFSLTMSSQNTPYVSFVNSDSNVVVEKLNANKNWVSVANSNIVPHPHGAPNNMSLTLDSLGNPYLAYDTSLDSANVKTLSQ